MKSLSIQLVVVVMTSVSAVQAQCRRPAGNQGFDGPFPYVSPDYVNGPCIAGHVHHSATAAESYWRGMAARVQAQGYYNLLTSAAAINAEEAQRLQMENKQKKVDVYYALREVNKINRELENEARRQRIESVARNQGGQPEQDATVEMAAVAIEWPAILKEPVYANYRKLVERVTAKRASGIQPTKEECSRLARTNWVVLSMVKDTTKNTSAADRDAARQFVENLVKGGNPETIRLATNR